MAITSFDPRNPRIVPHNGAPQITNRYLEANSQSFKAGELVQTSSGAVAVAAAAARADQNLEAGEREPRSLGDLLLRQPRGFHTLIRRLFCWGGVRPGIHAKPPKKEQNKAPRAAETRGAKSEPHTQTRHPEDTGRSPARQSSAAAAPGILERVAVDALESAALGVRENLTPVPRVGPPQHDDRLA